MAAFFSAGDMLELLSVGSPGSEWSRALVRLLVRLGGLCVKF